MKLRIVLILILLSPAVGLTQINFEPFKTHNQSPLIHFFGLPFSNGGIILPKNKFAFGSYLNVANNATASSVQNEAIYLDGEMFRNDFNFKYGLGRKIQVELNLPIIRHSAGIMDPVISEWHNTFGLPGKSRDQMSDYQLNYIYLENKEMRLHMSQSSFELGDISLKLSTSLLKNPLILISVGAFMKLSTGNKHKLIGSGTNDLGIIFSGRCLTEKIMNKFTLFYSAGYLHIGQGAVLSERLSRNVFFGNIGMGFHLKSGFIPKIQFDYHSGFYTKSETKQLGKESVQIVIGTDYYLTKRMNFSFSFSEDLIVNTAPDFVFQIGVSYKL